MLKARNFIKNKLRLRCCGSNLQKVFWTNILENSTGQMFLIVVLIVDLCLDNQPSKHQSWWRCFEEVLKMSRWCLQRKNFPSFKTSWRCLGRQKIVTLHYDKSRQPFWALLRFWLCFTSLQRQRPLIYSHDVTECMRLRGDRI